MKKASGTPVAVQQTPMASGDRQLITKDPQKEHDMVNHPPHYNQGGVESIDVIESFNLGFCDGNAIKYILRHQYKGSPLEDLKKARWYLNRLIEQMEAEHAVS